MTLLSIPVSISLLYLLFKIPGNRSVSRLILTKCSVLIFWHRYLFTCVLWIVDLQYSREKIMNKYIQALEDNDWIYCCIGLWKLLLFLVNNYHREGCTNINNYIWCLCVICRPLKSETRIFKFFILHCIDSIDDLGYSCGTINLFS